MKKCSSHGKKGTAISVSKSPQQKSSICRYLLLHGAEPLLNHRELRYLD